MRASVSLRHRNTVAEERNDGQERSQPATPRKLEQLRSDGQVPRSQDLAATGLLLAMAGALLAFGPHLVERLGGAMTKGFRANPKAAPDELVHARYEGLGDILLTVAPFLAIAAVAALIAPLAVGGWTFSGKPLEPDLSKLDPIKGLTKRVFTVRGLMEMVKAGAKFLLIGAVAVTLIYWQLSSNLALASMAPQPGLEKAVWTLGFSFLLLAAAMIVIAAIDVPFQRWNFARQNRMSFEELKRENRNEEGAPELRAKVRAMQREIAQRRMMEAVGEADVVITNPTHYAVALKYEATSRSAAPKLVASGVDLVSWQIRRRASEKNVPIVPAPALARAIYHTTDLGHEVPHGLYAAVAVVLRYAFRLAGKRGYHDAPPPGDLPIPNELRFD